MSHATRLRTPSALVSALVALALLVSAVPARSQCCILPDNGQGTVTMPTGCTYLGSMRFFDGLAPGDTIKIAASWMNFGSVVEAPGGFFGGTTSSYASNLVWQMTGTGSYAAYSRTLVMPLANPGFNVIESAARTPYALVQAFNARVNFLFGQIAGGDPDFDLIRVSAGNGFGLPSPGQTIFTTVSPSLYSVGSFFDITYRIDFVGAPGGPFAGRSGSTTQQDRFEICWDEPVPATPASWGAIKARSAR